MQIQIGSVPVFSNFVILDPHSTQLKNEEEKESTDEKKVHSHISEFLHVPLIPSSSYSFVKIFFEEPF